MTRAAGDRLCGHVAGGHRKHKAFGMCQQCYTAHVKRKKLEEAKRCKADGCARPARYAGYCARDYAQLYNYGRLLLTEEMKDTEADFARVHLKISKAGEGLQLSPQAARYVRDFAKHHRRSNRSVVAEAVEVWVIAMMQRDEQREATCSAKEADSGQTSGGPVSNVDGSSSPTSQ